MNIVRFNSYFDVSKWNIVGYVANYSLGSRNIHLKTNTQMFIVPRQWSWIENTNVPVRPFFHGPLVRSSTTVFVVRQSAEGTGIKIGKYMYYGTPPQTPLGHAPLYALWFLAFPFVGQFLRSWRQIAEWIELKYGVTNLTHI